MAIPFTQFLLPNGERRPELFDAAPEVEAMAQVLIDAGYRFECEILRNGLVHMDCNNGDDLLANEVVTNGPAVSLAVDRLVRSAHERYQATVGSNP